MAKVRSVVVSHIAKMSEQIRGAVDIFGAFDSVTQPLYPCPMPKLSIIVTLEDAKPNSMFEFRLNGPNDDLLLRGDIELVVDHYGIGKRIISIDNFLIEHRGKYTLDLFEKYDKELKFLKTETLFIADYPPKREPIPQAEIDRILADERLIKTVRTEFTPFGKEKELKIQHNLTKDLPIKEGYVEIPDDNRLEVDGEIIDLTGVKREIEWMFGSPIPKENEEEE